MTTVGGIGSIFSSLAGLSAGSTTHAAAPKPSAASATGFSPLDLLSRVQDRFSTSISTVLTDAANGAFDDPEIAARSAALRKSIAGMLATGQAAAGAGTIGRPTPTDGTGGAQAAPGEAVTGTGGALAAPADVAASQHQLMELDVQQAQTRLARVHASLTQRFAAGAQLPSAATGQLDYHSYRPRTSADADAFAQRMAIDVTEGAAALEVTATQLQLAKADAVLKPADTGAQSAVAALAAQYDSQQARVLDMVKVVDAQTGGAISTDTPTSAPDRAMAAVTAAAVADRSGSGDIATTVDKLSRMHTVVVDEATVPGGSKQLDRIVQTFSSAVARYFADEDCRADERRQDEQRQHEQQVADDQHDERKTQMNQQAEAHARQWAAERVALEQAAQQHAR